MEAALIEWIRQLLTGGLDGHHPCQIIRSWIERDDSGESPLAKWKPLRSKKDHGADFNVVDRVVPL